MRKFFVTLLTSILMMGAAQAAGDRGTKDEAKALVEKAVAVYQKEGEAAYAKFSDTKGEFVDRDLYIIAFNKAGDILAHGANKALIGVPMIDVKDPDGVFFVREFWKTANASPDGTGWVNFKFTRPGSGTIEKKEMYVKKVGEVIIIAGAYTAG